MLVWPSVPPEFCKDGAKLILALQTVNTCLKKQTNQATQFLLVTCVDDIPCVCVHLMGWS